MSRGVRVAVSAIWAGKTQRWTITLQLWSGFSRSSSKLVLKQVGSEVVNIQSSGFTGFVRSERRRENWLDTTWKGNFRHPYLTGLINANWCRLRFSHLKGAYVAWNFKQLLCNSLQRSVTQIFGSDLWYPVEKLFLFAENELVYKRCAQSKGFRYHENIQKTPQFRHKTTSTKVKAKGYTNGEGLGFCCEFVWKRGHMNTSGWGQRLLGALHARACKSGQESTGFFLKKSDPPPNRECCDLKRETAWVDLIWWFVWLSLMWNRLVCPLVVPRFEFLSCAIVLTKVKNLSCQSWNKKGSGNSVKNLRSDSFTNTTRCLL